MENRSRIYWIVGAIAAGGVLLSLILGAAAGGAAGYVVGKRIAQAEASTGRIGTQDVRPSRQLPEEQATPEAQVQPTPRGRSQSPSNVQVAAQITRVVEGSPADQAGLQVGDQIVGVDKASVTLMTELSQLIRQYEPGDTVTIRFLRDDETQSVQVDLGAHPDDEDAAYLGVEYRMSLQVETAPQQ